MKAACSKGREGVTAYVTEVVTNLMKSGSDTQMAPTAADQKERPPGGWPFREGYVFSPKIRFSGGHARLLECR